MGPPAVPEAEIAICPPAVPEPEVAVCPPVEIEAEAELPSLPAADIEVAVCPPITVPEVEVAICPPAEPEIPVAVCPPVEQEVAVCPPIEDVEVAVCPPVEAPIPAELDLDLPAQTEIVTCPPLDIALEPAPVEAELPSLPDAEVKPLILDFNPEEALPEPEVAVCPPVEIEAEAELPSLPVLELPSLPVVELPSLPEAEVKPLILDFNPEEALPEAEVAICPPVEAEASIPAPSATLDLELPTLDLGLLEQVAVPPVSEIPASLSTLLDDLTLEGEENALIPDLKAEISAPSLEISPLEK